MTTWTNQPKSLSSFANLPKGSPTSWTNRAKQTAGSDSFLLQESGFRLLLESAGSIVLRAAGGGTWVNRPKTI